MEEKADEDMQELSAMVESFEGAMLSELHDTKFLLEQERVVMKETAECMDALQCGVCFENVRQICFVRCGHLYYCQQCWRMGGALAIQHGCPICGKKTNGEPHSQAWMVVHHA